jgi:hypothetical protein
MSAVELFVWGFVAHLIGDWLLQNDWIANGKTSVFHPAAWVHFLIHWAALVVVGGWGLLPAFAVAAWHLFIDLRFLLRWWGEIIGQTSAEQNPAVHLHVAFWRDQVAHIAVLAVFAKMWGA